MSDRERWIVYPLLFLALGTALRDKITQSIEVDVIRCKQILVDDVRSKQILVGDDERQPKIVLGSNDAGGLVTVVDAAGELTLALGHIEGLSGLLAGAEGKLIQWVPAFGRPAN